jgi:hypothetical protein
MYSQHAILAPTSCMSATLAISLSVVVIVLSQNDRVPLLVPTYPLLGIVLPMILT